MFYVYAIINNSNKIYIGYTSNLDNRINRHNGLLKNKPTSYTSKNKNGKWKLVYTEKHEIKSNAIKREKQLKSYQGRQFIKNIINNTHTID